MPPSIVSATGVFFTCQAVQSVGNSEAANVEAFVAGLKSCLKPKDLEAGFRLHASFSRNRLLQKGSSIANILVDFYVKRGFLVSAQEAFDGILIRNINAWNALMAGHVKHCHIDEVLEIFERIQQEALCPDAVTFIYGLKTCIKACPIRKCREMHVQVLGSGLVERNIPVANALVEAYAKRGLLPEAQEVFDSLPIRDAVIWTALISGYVEHGLSVIALGCFNQSQFEGIAPDAVLFVCVLKACSKISAINEGQAVHAEICRRKSLEGNVFLCSSLIYMYAKCGLPRRSQEVFDKMANRNTITWTALVSGYVEYGCNVSAMMYFEKMQVEGIAPNVVTYVSILKACNTAETIAKGQEIHTAIECKGLREGKVSIGNALVGFYLKRGLFADAESMFNDFIEKNAVSWNILIAGYCERGHAAKALECLGWMQSKSFNPDPVAISCILKACGCIKSVVKGQEIHAEISRKGMLEEDIVIGNALIDMYIKCGLLGKAEEVFFEIPFQDTVTWTTIIKGYAEGGYADHALDWFKEMEFQGIPQNLVTVLCGLRACSCTGAVFEGQRIHAEIERKGWLNGDAILGNSLIDMYVKCGLLFKAKDLFNKLPVWNAVTWNALIAGYADDGHCEEALQNFEKMQLEGVSPDAVTFVSCLKATAFLGVTEKGQKIHGEIFRKGLLEEYPIVGNALVDMYAKCGSIAAARDVFDNLSVQDLVSWNSLLAGYVQNGESDRVFQTLENMLSEDMKPNLITFAIVLNACSKNGLINTSHTFFENMSENHAIVATPWHYVCMVDLLGRIGELQKAATTIQNLSICPDPVLWLTLLGACRKWGNVELGKQAFEQAVALDKMDSAAYILMSQIYADTGIIS